MKHSISVVAVILALFAITQVFGLTLLLNDIQKTGTDGSGNIVVVHSNATEQMRPQTKGVDSFLYIIIGVAFATILLLVLIRFAKHNVWTAWYFLAVAIAVSISLTVFIKNIIIVYLLSIMLAYIKIKKPNVILHNLIEILMLSGLALLLTPIFNLLWAAILLIAISIYDFIAVKKTKHMIKMAKFTASSSVFPGIMIPYGKNKIRLGRLKKTSLAAGKKTGGERTAILGGGDVVFPLIFAGVVLEDLVIKGMPKLDAFYFSMIIVACTTASLLALFAWSQKNKFYPAMPVVSAGCFIGFLIIKLIA